MQLIPIEKIFSNRDSMSRSVRPGKLYWFQKAGQLIPTVLISAKKRIRFQFIIQSHFRYFSVTLSIWIQICCNCLFCHVFSSITSTSILSLSLSLYIYTAISRKFVKNKVHATIPKGNMGYDRYPVSNHCSCRTCFCYFPSALANIYQWPPVRFF